MPFELYGVLSVFDSDVDGLTKVTENVIGALTERLRVSVSDLDVPDGSETVVLSL